MGGFSFPGGVRRTPISRRGQPRGQPGFEIGLSSLGRADGEVVPVDGVEARRVLRVDIDPAREVLVGVANDRCTARGVTSCAGSGSAANEPRRRLECERPLCSPRPLIAAGREMRA